MEILRVTKESPLWQIHAYNYIRTDAFCYGQSIPVETEFLGDGAGEDFQGILILEDHKPVSGLRIAYPRPDVAKIERVCTVREKQKGGYGRIMIAEAEKWIAEKGISHIVISSQDRAQGFYEKCGYVLNPNVSPSVYENHKISLPEKDRPKRPEGVKLNFTCVLVEKYLEKPERNLNFDEVIERRGTDSLKYDFAVKRGKEADVLPLWVADMDFRTSSHILDALSERTQHGIFGYTETQEDYYEALANWMKKHHDLEIRPEWVLKTPGVVFAVAAAVKAYTKEGDYVLIQQPVYYPLSEAVRDNGRKVVSNDLILENGHYRIDFEDFEKKVTEYGVKLFMLCNPHNPVGRVWTREELKRLADICLRHGVIVVSDEIHEDFVYPGHKHVSFLTVDERAKDISITCTSVSKTFNLAGLQIANILVPNKDLARKLKKQISAAGYSQINTYGVAACKAAYQHGEVWHAAVCDYIKGNLDFLRDYLRKNIPEVELIEPEGTYLVWLDFRKLDLSNQELQDLIVKRAKLWLDDGYIFGKQGTGFQRINLATPRAVLLEALERLESAVHAASGIQVAI